MSISEITNSVKPLDIVNKINEVIPVTNASVPDGTLSESSTNSIQNKVVTQALNDKQNSSTAVTHSQTTAVGDTVTPVYVDTDGSVKTISNSLGTAAFQNITSSYSASGTAPINGTAVASAISGKQDVISDLDDIRAGALYGASALQPNDVVSTYSATGTVPINGTAVASALGTLDIPTVDQTYNASSTNAQSGTAVASAISGKQDVIGDLSDIRLGASAGVTALQPSDVTSSYSASGTSPVNGTAIANALANINVDQTYNALSTVAQSGTAVDQALSTLSIPEVDQTYSASSTSAQSGTAVASAVSGILPDQTGNEGKFLTTDGTIVSWETVQGGGSAQIQSDWLQSDNTKKDFIKNKPTALSSFIDDLGSSPTHTHNQYELISKPINTLTSSGTIALEDNTERSITPTGNVTFILPTVTDNTVTHKIVIQLNLSTVYTIDLGLGATPHYFHKTAPDLSNIGVYDLIYIYDKANQYWVAGAIEKGATS